MIVDRLDQHGVILFDGIYNLCNASVLFVLQHERQPVFRFASLQSDAGQQLLDWCGLPTDYRQAVILIDNGKIDFGSTAALKIGRTLKFPWLVLGYLGFLLPRFIRDWVYNQIASHRYRWFGKRDICMVPTEALKKRFL
jgi:predicted DCC family thiol-disulfide oxidoreductase YuxK